MGAEICFDGYLRSVVSAYQQWWRLYTLTDVEGEIQAQNVEQTPSFPFAFDLDQKVKSVEPPKPDKDGMSGQKSDKEEKPEYLPVLEGIYKYAGKHDLGNHVLLVGRPGSGKSTALARLLLQEAENALEDKQAKIPVLVELRYLPSEANESSVCDRILTFMHKHDPALDVDEAGIKQLLRQGRLLMLVDGVNELPSDRGRVMVNQFRELYQKTCPMIFTTRELSAGGDLGIAKRLEMQPLTEPQMQQFVMAYLPTQGEKLLRQLSGRLREFGQTPLLLWMLCSLFQQSEQIPPNLGMVFRAFTLGYGDSIKQDVTLSKDSRAWWGRLLQYLAFKMTCGESLTELQVAISRREAERFLVEFLRGKVEFADDCAVRWLEDLLKHHLIQISNDRIEFRHQLIQEYYAAEWLLGLLPNLSDARLQQGYLNYLKWTEPLALMLELVEGEEQAVRVVRLALEVDLRLGARLAGAVRYGFQEKTVGLLIREIDERKTPQLYAIELLGKTRSDYTIKSLIQGFKGKDSHVHEGIAHALGGIGSYEAIEFLILILRDKSSDVRRIAVDSLGKIGGDKSVELLILALKDKSPNVRRRAAHALVTIGGDKVVELLILALKDKSSAVREKAAYILGDIGSDKAFASLIPLLKDKDRFVCVSSAQALGKIDINKAIELLSQAIRDEDFLVHRNIANALKNIENEKNNKILNEYFTNIVAVDGLGVDKCEKNIESLIQSLKGEDYFVRKWSIEALSEINTETIIEPLIQSLNDEDYFVRQCAAKVLGKINTEKIIEPLIEGFKDKDPNARRRIIEILGKNNSDKAIEILVQALKDKDSSVSRRAAEILGKINSDKAVELLIQLLQDKDPKVCKRVAEILGKINSDKAVESLIQSLNSDTNWDIIDLPEKIAKADRNLPTLTQQLPHLLTLIPTKSSQQALSVITAIQFRCKYYNYDIAQTPLPPEDNPNPTTGNTYIFNDKVDQVVAGNLTVHGDNIATQNNPKPAPES